MTVAPLVLSFLPVGCPRAVIFAYLARYQIKRYPQDGRGLAMAGLVIGYLHMTFWVITIVMIRTTAV